MSNISVRTLARTAPLLAVALWAVPAWAQEQTGQMTVRAEVVETCELTVAPLDFGTTTATSDVLPTDINSSSSATVQCPDGRAWEITMDAGENGQSGQRRMAGSSGPGTVAYNLSLEPSLAPLPEVITGTGFEVVTLYGRVPAGQTVSAAGEYSDQVLLTISF